MAAQEVLDTDKSQEAHDDDICAFPGCLPSIFSNVYDDRNWTTLLLAGCAIVATDYAEPCNNSTVHRYVAIAKDANDT